MLRYSIQCSWYFVKPNQPSITAILTPIALTTISQNSKSEIKPTNSGIEADKKITVPLSHLYFFWAWLLLSSYQLIWSSNLYWKYDSSLISTWNSPPIFSSITIILQNLIKDKDFFAIFALKTVKWLQILTLNIIDLTYPIT